RSPGRAQGGSPALVYNSSLADGYPTLQAAIQTPNTAQGGGARPLPAHATVNLVWNGATQTTHVYNFFTGADAPGEVFTVAVQPDQPVTATNRYTWSLRVSLDYTDAGGPVVLTTPTAAAYVVAQDASPLLEPGWSFSMIDRLVYVAPDMTNNFP